MHSTRKAGKYILPVPNPWDTNALLFHAFNELVWCKTLARQPRENVLKSRTIRGVKSKVIHNPLKTCRLSYPVIGILEVSSSIINGTTKSRTNCEQACIRSSEFSFFLLSNSVLKKPLHNKLCLKIILNSYYLPETRLETRSFPALAVTIAL